MNIGFHDSIKHIENYQYNTLQIFTKNPRKYYDKTMEINIQYKNIIKEKKIKLFIHTAYGSVLTKNDNNTRRRNMSIINDMIYTHNMGGIGVVVHVGTSLDDELDNIYNNIKYILSKTKNLNVKLLLENSTKTKNGKSVMNTIEDILKIMSYIKSKSIEIYNNLYFCLDICHIYVTYKYYNSNMNFIDDMKKIDKKLILVHFNDAKSDTRDIHADIFTGNIPALNLIEIARYCNINKIPMIIERYGNPKNETEYLKKKINWNKQILDIKSMI